MIGGTATRLSDAAVTAYERALPLLAGTALATSTGGEGYLASGALLLVIVVTARHVTPSGKPLLEGLCFGLAPVLLGYLLTAGSIAALREPLVWSIGVPFAIYATNFALVKTARAGAASLFAILNALALAALAIPVVAGQIHWAIAILPFAAFRVASSAAEKLRADAECAERRQEAGEVARKILWVSGAWIAGWAGVTP